MSLDGFVEELQHRTPVQTQRLYDGENALYEATPGCDVAAKRTAPPQDRGPLGTLDVVVGRFDTVYNHECPQRR